MKRISGVIIVAAAPLLMAAIWMDRQPSYKPYEEPILTPPAGAVPISGRENVQQQSRLPNPVKPTTQSLEIGKHLFDINCVMCHGHTSAKPGPVGQKLTPPPPGLDQERLRGLSDTKIYRAISLGFGRMPPFQSRLKPEERWHLVNFLRTRK